jgi:hypothetical protein
MTEDERAARVDGRAEMDVRRTVRCCDFENLGHGS